jgi:hypothetical protein
LLYAIPKPGCGLQNSRGRPFQWFKATNRSGGPALGYPRADVSRRLEKGRAAAIAPIDFKNVRRELS